MKRFVLAAALLGVVVLPAGEAGAVPPGNSSVPLGSTKGCFVVGLNSVLPGTCNFVGTGGGPPDGDIGYIGGGSGYFEISHQRKVVTCDGAGKVSGYHLTKAVGQSGDLTPPNAAGTASWTSGVVYTVTVTGFGWLAVGGSGSPADLASSTEPAAPSGQNFAGSEDGTGGKTVGQAC
jgi:hypothetical protein